MPSQHLRAASLAAATSALIVVSGLPSAQAAPAANASLRAAEHARIVKHWTPDRRAAAIPRDFVLDGEGRAFMKLPGGALQPYGRSVAEAGRQVPTAKPGGGGGGGKPGTGDTTPPSVSAMSPGSGDTIGASATFSALVTDAGGLRSVSFVIWKGAGAEQSFSASSSGDTWGVSLQGFVDGADWFWRVEATDRAGNRTVSNVVNFNVVTGGGGGGGGGTGDVVVNERWSDGGALQTAAGRIYFEMPQNASRRRWAGYVCSGTVVTDNTSGRSVILTAAHCVYDDANKAFARNVLFIPDQDGTSGAGTDRNCDNDPLGCWTPAFGVVDVEWTTRTFPDNIPWDYAFYVVPDSGAHTGTAVSSDSLESEAGGMTLSFAAPVVGDYTHALGYSYSDDPYFMYCAEDMGTEGTANWWLPSCGLSGGASGGPWTQGGNGGTSFVMSVNSWGYTGSPGMAGPKLDDTSASCLYDTAIGTDFNTVPASDGDAGVSPSGC
jgi:hypothetical protein